MRRIVLVVGTLGLMVTAGSTGAEAQRRQGYRIGNVNVRVVRGDLMKTPAKALVTPINSGGPGLWNGKVDRVIMGTVGTGYHQQLNRKLPQFGDLKTVVARGTKQRGRNAFEHVVFVGDNLQSSLKKVVCSGLECASRAGFSSVSMPAMRMGVMRGAVERTTQDTMNGMVQGIKRYAAKVGASGTVRDVTIVVHSSQDTINALNTALGAAGR